MFLDNASMARPVYNELYVNRLKDRSAFKEEMARNRKALLWNCCRPFFNCLAAEI